MPKRLIASVGLWSPQGIIHRNYIGSKRVDELAFGEALRKASIAGTLVYVVTQSTGFGWRTVWEIRDA